jgi:rhamnulose-1-phosphate aldolase
MLEEKFIKELIKTSADMWDKGWAERNAGNITVRIDKDIITATDQLNFDGAWVMLEKPLPNLAGEYFLVSGTGKFLRNISVFPMRNLGMIEIDENGASYRIIWGYEGGGEPTSETPAHLQAHSVRKKITDGVDRVVIHTHTPNLIALTYALDLDTPRLTQLLWKMHVECPVVFPKGVEFLPWMMAGSQEIADATAKAFYKRDIVMWQHHGVFATGRNLDTAFGLIDTVEKASDIYIKTATIGGVKNEPSLDTLISIARNFGLELAEDIIEHLRKN